MVTLYLIIVLRGRLFAIIEDHARPRTIVRPRTNKSVGTAGWNGSLSESIMVSGTPHRRGEVNRFGLIVTEMGL